MSGLPGASVTLGDVPVGGLFVAGCPCTMRKIGSEGGASSFEPVDLCNQCKAFWGIPDRAVDATPKRWHDDTVVHVPDQLANDLQERFG